MKSNDRLDIHDTAKQQHCNVLRDVRIPAYYNRQPQNHIPTFGAMSTSVPCPRPVMARPINRRNRPK